MIALCFMAGEEIGHRYLNARFAHERRLCVAVAEVAAEVRHEEMETLARKIRNEVVDAL